MKLACCCGPVVLTTVFALLLAANGAAQEKTEVVPRTASSELVEKTLAGLDTRYEKKEGKTPNLYFYNYERNRYKIRLGNHGGKLLWLSAAFPRTSPEQINAWNVRAKFSRAVLNRDGNQENAVIEAQFDCAGGITAGVLRQFLLRFDEEVRNFDQFLSQ
jgi:hypothetical protein